MELSKLQNLVNECIMMQQDYPLNWEFEANLKEVQEELDAVKSLLLVVIKSFNAPFKKGEEVIYGTDINATVIEELKNNIVHIDIRNFGRIKVKKQDLRLATKSF